MDVFNLAFQIRQHIAKVLTADKKKTSIKSIITISMTPM